MRKSKRAAMVASAVSAVLSGAQLHGATISWTTTTGSDWNTGANWATSTGAAGVPGTADAATFTATGNRTVNLSAPASVTRVTFSVGGSSGYTIGSTGGFTLTVSATGTTATTSAINGGNTSGLDTISCPVTFSSSSSQTIIGGTTKGTLSFTGALTASNSNPLLTAGSGTMIFSNASNSFGGGINVGINHLQFANGALGSSGAITFASGSALQWATGNTQDVSARFVGNTVAPIDIDPNGQTIIFGNAINSTNTQGLSLSTGNGTLTLSVANSYTGTTAIDTNTTLNIGNSGAISSGALNFIGNGAFDNTTGSPLTLANALQTTGGSPTFIGTNDATFSASTSLTATSGSSRTFTVTASTLTLAGSVGETGAGNVGLTKAGAGTLTLLASNSFTGGVTINSGSGVLNINNANALGTGSFQTASTFDNTTGSPLTLATNNIISIAKTTTFGGTNAMTFGTGAVQVISTTFTANGTANLTFNGALQNVRATAGPAAFVVNTNANTVSFAGMQLANTTSAGMTIGGTGNVVITGPIVDGTAGGTFGFAGGGLLVLQASSSYTGATSITGGGTLKLANLNALGNTPSISESAGSVLDFNGLTLAGALPITLSSSGLLNSNATSINFSGSIALTGGTTSTVDGTGNITLLGSIQSTNTSSGLTKNGQNILTLSASNNYVGKTVVSAGTLVINNTSALGSGNSSISAGATMDLNGVTLTAPPNITNGSFGLAGKLTNSSSTPVTYSGQISVANGGIVDGTGDITLSNTVTGAGAGPLLKNGSNTLTFNGSPVGADTSLGILVNSGTLVLARAGTGIPAVRLGLTINGGTVALGGSGGDQIADGQVVTINNGLFNVGAFTETVKTVQIGGTSAATITGTAGGVLSLTTTIDARNGSSSAVLGGTAALNKTVSNTTVTLTSSNTYTGNTSISAGTLALSTSSNAAPIIASAGSISTSNGSGTNGGVLSLTYSGASGSGTNLLAPTASLYIYGTTGTFATDSTLGNSAVAVAMNLPAFGSADAQVISNLFLDGVTLPAGLYGSDQVPGGVDPSVQNYFTGTGDFLNTATPAPEPGTLGLIGLSGLLLRRRRRNVMKTT